MLNQPSKSGSHAVIATIVVVLIVIAVGILVDNSINQANVYPIDQTEATSTPALDRSPTPSLRRDYHEGETLEYIGGGTDFCSSRTWDGACYPDVNLKQGDVVVVVNSEPIFIDDGVTGKWWWQVRGCNGGVYVQNKSGVVQDTARFASGECGEPRPPNVGVGETAALNYNYFLRPFSGGETASGNTEGEPLLSGGDLVTVLEITPEPENGHYWCKVQTQSGRVGWLPCEFQRSR